MPGWKLPQTVKVKMPEELADELWLEIQNPRMLPFDAMQHFLALAPSQGADPDVAGFDLASARDLATSLITDWNLPAPDGSILPLPSKEPSVWQKIPAMAVVTAIFEALAEAAEVADPNSSSGSAKP